MASTSFFSLDTSKNLRQLNMSDITLPISGDALKVKALTYENYTTPLSVIDFEIPIDATSVVKPTEILLQMKASSLNPVDCILKQMSNNWFGPKVKIIGGDFAGVVVKAGAETDYKPGDKLYGDLLSLKTRGSCSDFVIFEPAKALVCEKIPENMTFEEAGSLGCVSNTAFEGLQKYNGDLEGKNILVLGAGTSVGFFSVQFAKHFFKAANVVATCSSTSKEKTINAGADITIDYSKGDEYKISEMKKFVSENGKFDLIIDCVRDEIVIDYFVDILKPGTEKGVFAQVGGSYVIDYKDIHLYNFLPSFKILLSGWKYRLGFSKFPIESVWTSRDAKYGPAIEQLWKEDKLNITIDSVYNVFTEFDDAFERVASCKAKGKVVLKF